MEDADAAESAITVAEPERRLDNMQDVDAADLCRDGAGRGCARRMIMMPAALQGRAAGSRQQEDK